MNECHGRELARTVNGRTLSEGRRQLRIVARATKQIIVAAQLGCTEAYVGMLLAGKRVPRARMQARIWLAFGIPGHEWGLAPTQLSVGLESSTDASAESTVDASTSRDERAAE